MGCGHEKAVKLLAELDGDKGVGLIERVKQGQGKPTKIYVKRFAEKERPPEKQEDSGNSRLPIFGSQKVGKAEVKTSDFRKSRVPNFGSADFRKPDASYNNIIYTDLSYTDSSIYPAKLEAQGAQRLGSSLRGRTPLNLRALAPAPMRAIQGRSDDKIDRRRKKEEIKEQIDYGLLKTQYP